MSLANCLERCGKTVDFIYALDDRRKFPFEARTKNPKNNEGTEGTTTLRQVDQEIDRSRLVNVLCAAERVQNLDELGNSWQFMAIHHSSDEDRQSQVIFNETHLNSHEIYDALTALSTCFNIMD